MSDLITAGAAIAAALGLAAAAGVLHNRRSGVLRDIADPAELDTAGLGLSTTAPNTLGKGGSMLALSMTFLKIYAIKEKKRKILRKENLLKLKRKTEIADLLTNEIGGGAYEVRE